MDFRIKLPYIRCFETAIYSLLELKVLIGVEKVFVLLNQWIGEGLCET